MASVTIQAAGTIMAAERHEEAIARAEVALRRLPAGEARLELLARNVITESLVYLGRPDEALHSLFATLPLYEELRSLRTELQLGYLVALLLDALGYDREAEAAFRDNVWGFMDAELYKDAFLTVMRGLNSSSSEASWTKRPAPARRRSRGSRRAGWPATPRFGSCGMPSWL